MPKCLTIKGETELFLKYSTVKWQPIKIPYFSSGGKELASQFCELSKDRKYGQHTLFI